MHPLAGGENSRSPFDLARAGSRLRSTITLPVQSITCVDFGTFSPRPTAAIRPFCISTIALSVGQGGWRRIDLPALEQQSGSLSRRRDRTNLAQQKREEEQ